jgi:hypothetical protein
LSVKPPSSPKWRLRPLARDDDLNAASRPWLVYIAQDRVRKESWEKRAQFGMRSPALKDGECGHSQQ